jgi:hypothetical protein
LGIKAILISLVMISAFIASAEVEESMSAAKSSCELCSVGPQDLGAGHDSGESELWALDSCDDRHSEVDLPSGTSAMVEISPGYSSYVTLYQRLPSGDLQAEYLGYLYRGHSYRLGLCPLLIGTHELWFRTGWQESNRIRLHIGV